MVSCISFTIMQYEYNTITLKEQLRSSSNSVFTPLQHVPVFQSGHYTQTQNTKKNPPRSVRDRSVSIHSNSQCSLGLCATTTILRTHAPTLTRNRKYEVLAAASYVLPGAAAY